jgi:hypothetical protein
VNYYAHARVRPQDFDKFVIDEATRQGVQLFLKELERDKYKVCSGALTEVSKKKKEELKTAFSKITIFLHYTNV